MLTTKQETFCLKYVELDYNGTQAVLASGYRCTPASARTIAAQNLTKVDIITRIAELRKRLEDASIASPQERRKVLTEIVRGRPNQFMQGNRINATVKDLNTAAVSEVVTQEIQLGKGDDAAIVDVVKLKLRDPVTAIAELNKMDGSYAPEKREISGNITFNVISRIPRPSGNSLPPDTPENPEKRDVLQIQAAKETT